MVIHNLWTMNLLHILFIGCTGLHLSILCIQPATNLESKRLYRSAAAAATNITFYNMCIVQCKYNSNVHVPVIDAAVVGYVEILTMAPNCVSTTSLVCFAAESFDTRPRRRTTVWLSLHFVSTNRRQLSVAVVIVYRSCRTTFYGTLCSNKTPYKP